MARGNLHARKKVIEEAFVIGIRLLLQGTCELVAVSFALKLLSKDLITQYENRFFISSPERTPRGYKHAAPGIRGTGRGRNNERDEPESIVEDEDEDEDESR